MNDILLASWIAEIRPSQTLAKGDRTGVRLQTVHVKPSLYQTREPAWEVQSVSMVTIWTLACYHGINFRSKSWALFTLAEPNICFATGAQDGINSGEFINKYLSWNYLFFRQPKLFCLKSERKRYLKNIRKNYKLYCTWRCKLISC